MSIALYRNTALGLVAKVLVNVMVFLAGIFVVRLTTTDDYGKYAYVSSLAGIFGVVINFGLGNFFIREMSREKEQGRHLLGVYQGLQSVIAVLVYGALILFALLHQDFILRYGILVFGASLFVSALFTPYMCVLASRLRNDLVYVHMSLQAILQFALTAVGFFTALPLAYYMTLPFLVSLSRLLHSWRDTKRLGLMHKPVFEWSHWRKALRAGLPFSVLTTVNILYVKVDILLFSHFESDHWTAIYAVAARLAYLLIILPTTLVENLYPVFSENMADQRETYKSLLGKFTVYNWTLCLGLFVGGIVESSDLIRILFGERYLPAIIPFCIYLGLPLLLSLYIGANNYVIATGGTWFLVLTNLAGLVLNTFGNVWVLRLYDGVPAMIGASIVTIGCEILLCILSIFYVVQKGMFRPEIRHFVRPLIPAALMVGILFLLSPVHLFVRIAVGAIAYAWIAWRITLVDPQDQVRLRNWFYTLLRQK